MTAGGANAFPLAGSTTVEGPGFQGSLGWYTVNGVAYVSHAVVTGQPMFQARDMGAVGKTLIGVRRGLSAHDVTVQLGVDTAVGEDDVQGVLISASAGLVADGLQVVMRRSVPVADGDRAGASGVPSARPLDAAADAGGWSAFEAAAGSAFSSRRSGEIPDGFLDRVAVVADDGGNLLAYCWVRLVRSHPQATPTAEIVSFGAAASVAAEAVQDHEWAAFVAATDLLAAEGVRTVAVAVDESATDVVERLTSWSFVARRHRHLYRPA